MTSLEKHINKCLTLTNEHNSKITKEILEIDGMSGKKTRHFYNNICSMEDARYLEIGTWKGSSICSAMCNNKMTCVAIDNWSEFGGPKNEFLENYNKFKGDNTATFIEKNCWEVDVSTLGKFNIYMYDGNHYEDSHYQALNHYLQCLDTEFIYLVDDWNWSSVRNGTIQSIKDNNCEILYQKEIYTPSNDSKNDWHNGISIFVLKKTNKKQNGRKYRRIYTDPIKVNHKIIDMVNKTFKIKSLHTNHCFDIENNKIKLKIVSDSDSQLWKMDDKHRIIHVTTNKFLDFDYERDLVISMNDENIWDIYECGYIINSKYNMAVDFKGGLRDMRLEPWLYNFNHSKAQQWEFIN